MRTSARAGFVALLALLTAAIFGRLNLASLAVNAVPWGAIVVAVTTWMSRDRREALTLGGTFGFIVSYAYLWFDNYHIMSLHQVLILIPLIVLPALFGLVCGVALGYLGWRVRRRWQRASASDS